MRNGWAKLLRSKRGTAGVATQSLNSDFRLLQETSFWRRDLELSGTCAVTVATSAALERVRELAGSCAITVGTSSADVVRVRALAGTCAIVTTLAASVSRVRDLTGTCAITTAFTGTISAYNGPIYRELAATVAIHSGFAGSLERIRALSGTCAIVLTPTLGALQRLRVRQIIPLTTIAPAANSLTACTSVVAVPVVASPITQALAGLPV
jgi:hypothetical protein